MMTRILYVTSNPSPVSYIFLILNLLLLILFFFGGITDELQRDLTMIAIALTWGGWVGIDIDHILAMRGGGEDA